MNWHLVISWTWFFASVLVGFGGGLLVQLAWDNYKTVQNRVILARKRNAYPYETAEAERVVSRHRKAIVGSVLVVVLAVASGILALGWGAAPKCRTVKGFDFTSQFGTRYHVPDERYC